MRYLLFMLLLTGCSAQAASISNKPSGEEVFNILLKNGMISLADEPLCKADISLNKQLSLNLSISYESKNTTTIKSYCVPSKTELRPGKVIDIWDCTVRIGENNKKNEFVSSSTIVFSITKDKHKFIRGSMRCR